jgi:hypothetical protein
VWVGSRINGGHRGFGNCKAVGVAHQGRIIAGVVLHDWSPETGVIELTAAADDRRWMTRHVVTEILSYPFGFARMVVARFAPDGPPRRIFAALGADEFRIPRLAGPDSDLIIATLTREQWAICPLNIGKTEHGQARSADAA